MKLNKIYFKDMNTIETQNIALDVELQNMHIFLKEKYLENENEKL